MNSYINKNGYILLGRISIFHHHDLIFQSYFLKGPQDEGIVL